MVSRVDIEGFITRGFVRVDDAFPREVAEAGREILWRATGCDPADPSTWTRPVVRIGERFEAPFVEAAGTARLRAAFDALVGPGQWLPRASLGTFPIRFPSNEAPDDAGWHIDASLGWETTADFLEWRTNVVSDGRALLMLFLFSDVSELDAPTRLRIGSHVGIARRLAPAGKRGLTLRELAATGFAESAECEEALAVGPAGTVYLCHPFVVHAAQAHRGTSPRFLAQPPLFPREPLVLDRIDGTSSPVEEAIRRALATA